MIENNQEECDTHIFLIAGEPSGDALGAKLMRSLTKKAGGRNLRFSGIGGERMIAEGFRSLFDMSELSVMGFAEVLPHIRHLRQRMEDLAEIIADANPDMLITIDSPGFCTRLVKKLRRKYQKTFPMIHYVAPTVWAYKPKRAKKFAELYDHLLVLLPFEPPYFEAEGLPATFVGHPIVEEPIKFGEGRQFRLMRDIAPSALVVTVLAGSREGEIARLLPVYRQAFEQLALSFHGMTVLLPTLPHLLEKVKFAVRDWPIRTIVTADTAEKYAGYAASQVALVKSGTATLEVAMARVPMVVAYKVNFLTAWLLKCMIKVPYVTLINLILGKQVIPELLQWDCTPLQLAKAVESLVLERSTAEAQILACHEALKQLGQGGKEMPSEKAADVVLRILDERELQQEKD